MKFDDLSIRICYILTKDEVNNLPLNLSPDELWKRDRLLGMTIDEIAPQELVEVCKDNYYYVHYTEYSLPTILVRVSEDEFVGDYSQIYFKTRFAEEQRKTDIRYYGVFINHKDELIDLMNSFDEQVDRDNFYDLIVKKFIPHKSVLLITY